MPRWTADNIPDLTGRTAVVTGANSGVGYHVALELARHGARVLLATRDAGRGAAAVDRIRAELRQATVEWQALDLADLASVRRFADAILADQPALDLLVNNAGVMMLPRQRTADGFEIHVGTNHLGHFALTGLVLPALLATPGARVVTVTSPTHRRGRIDEVEMTGGGRYRRAAAYANSKLANLLFAVELQRRVDAAHAALLSVAAHPGFAATSLGTGGGPVNRVVFGIGMRLGQPASAGALPLLYAATAPGVAGGELYAPDGPGEMRGHPRLTRGAAHAYDEVLARQLWDVSERLTGVRYEALTQATGP